MRRIQDAGSGVETPDVNFRFLPCLVAGLAYYIAQKDPELAPRVPMLQTEYERQFDLAAQEVAMSQRFASGAKALAICDICGFQYELRELRNLVKKNKVTELKACPECWNPDHPQNRLGEFPVDDPQAIRNPRPDFAELPASRAHIQPADANNMSAFGQVGEVTISIT
jgi:hypothetical protein